MSITKEINLEGDEYWIRFSEDKTDEDIVVIDKSLKIYLRGYNDADLLNLFRIYRSIEDHNLFFYGEKYFPVKDNKINLRFFDFISLWRYIPEEIENLCNNFIKQLYG